MLWLVSFGDVGSIGAVERGVVLSVSGQRSECHDQAPLASFSGTDNRESTHYPSNIRSQKRAALGVMLRLEEAVRALAGQLALASVYVMTGPL